MVSVGDKGVRVSFGDWAVSADVEDNSTIVAAVTTLGVPASEGDRPRSDGTCDAKYW